MTHYLKQYTKFETMEEMDTAAELHVSRNWNELTKSDRQVFDVIRRNSLEYGATHLKYGTIEEAIGKSNATVRRGIRKLVSLEIIEKVHFIRPVMKGLGANIYIMLPFDHQSEMGRNTPSDKQYRQNQEKHVS